MACLRKEEKLVGCFFGSGASACFRKVEKSIGRFWRAAPALPASMSHPALSYPVIPLTVVWLEISNACVVLWDVVGASEGVVKSEHIGALPCCGADFAPGLRKVLKSASLGCALGLKELHMHLYANASCPQFWHF